MPNDSGAPALGGKWQPLLLLVCGSVLTITGGFIQSCRQNQLWTRQHAVAVKEKRAADALATFDEVSKAIGAPLASARKVFDDIYAEMPADSLRADYSQYRLALERFNHDEERQKALLAARFDSVTVSEYVELVQRLQQLKKSLERVADIRPSYGPNSVEDNKISGFARVRDYGNLQRDSIRRLNSAFLARMNTLMDSIARQ